MSIDPPSWSTLPLGAIVGRASIVDCFPIAELDDATRTLTMEQEWWAFGPFCAVLADVEPCEAFPYRGALGLFDVPESIAAQLRFASSSRELHTGLGRTGPQ